MSTNIKTNIKKNALRLSAIIIRATQIGVSTAAGLFVAEKVTEKSQSMTVGTAAGAASAVATYHLYDMVVDNVNDGIEVITDKIEAAKAKAVAQKQMVQQQIDAANDIAAAQADPDAQQASPDAPDDFIDDDED